MDIRGSKSLKIDIDEDTGKAKCEKHPHGFPTEIDGEDACLIVYKEDGEKLDEKVEVENISEGNVTLKNKSTGETKDYEL